MPIFKRGEKYRVIIQHRGRKKEWLIEGTKKDAEAFEAQKQIELRIELGTEMRSVPRFEAFSMGEYLTHANLHLKASTMRNRKYILEELILFFGDTRLNEIDLKTVERYAMQRMRSDIKPATINTELRVLKRILSVARERGVLLKPYKFRSLPERGERKVKAWTNAEIQALFVALADMSPSLVPMVLMLANTGCRRGEAIALQWDNVDLARRVITIWPSEEWQPKNGKPREVPINDVLLRWLGNLERVSRYVFPSPETGGRYAFWPQRAFDRARKAAGLQGGPHTLRHTYATQFLQTGGYINTLAEILGHSNAHITTTYRHLLPGHLDQDRQRVQFDPGIGFAELKAKERWGRDESLVRPLASALPN